MYYLSSSIIGYKSFNTIPQHVAEELTSNLMKKALGETQTLRAGCSKTEPKIFAPLQTPSQGAPYEK